jgi:hypothetical protein
MSKEPSASAKAGEALPSASNISICFKGLREAFEGRRVKVKVEQHAESRVAI